jgi:hypothetical protein
MMGVQGGAVTTNAGNAAYVAMMTPDLLLATSISVSCVPHSIPVNATTFCTAKATGQTPRNYLSWSSNGTGTFSSLACDMSGGSCSVNFTAYFSGNLAITAHYNGDYNTAPTNVRSVVTVIAPASSTTTSSTTTGSTSVSTSATASGTTSSTSSTSSAATTTTSTTSSPSSTNQTTSTAATTQASGGIPEFPYEMTAVTIFSVIVVTSYLLARRRMLLHQSVGA